MVSKEDLVWGFVVAAATALEIEAIRRGELERTITRTTRRWFHTHHPVGRSAFLVTWVGFSAWYAQHILKGSKINAPLAP